MDSELSFLISLLLNDDVPKEIKALLKDRIKLVEESYKAKPQIVAHPGFGGIIQAQSTQRILSEMPQEVPIQAATVSPVAAQALANRAQLMADASSGRKEPGRTSPRKF